jgi:hypothetical protein
MPRPLIRCGLACGTGRLGAPGWAGEKAAFLSILRGVLLLPQTNRTSEISAYPQRFLAASWTPHRAAENLGFSPPSRAMPIERTLE